MRDTTLDHHLIQRTARSEAAAAITPLELGQPIAWSKTTRSGVTDGISSLHRVGLPKGNLAYTACDLPIADPVLWLSLSPAIADALLPCGFCEAVHRDQRLAIAS